MRSGDAELFYEVSGDGPSVVLLHPFPLNHNFWTAIVAQLSSRYRLIIPDLRAHGASELGDGPRPCRSWPTTWRGYAAKRTQAKPRLSASRSADICLFEFWRRYREQVAALVLANTRAGAETPDSKARAAAGRRQSAA